MKLDFHRVTIADGRAVLYEVVVVFPRSMYTPSEYRSLAVAVVVGVEVEVDKGRSEGGDEAESN